MLRSGDQLQIGQDGDGLYRRPGRRPAGGGPDSRIRMFSKPDADLASQIVSTIGDAEGSRILTRPARRPIALAPDPPRQSCNPLRSQPGDQPHPRRTDQLLDRILELTFRSIEADRGCVMLLNPDTGVLEPKAARWRRAGPTGTEPMAVSRTITDHVLRERLGVLVSDAAHDDRFAAGQSIIKTGIREAICVPMKGRHESLGVLYLDTVTRLATARNPSNVAPHNDQGTDGPRSPGNLPKTIWRWQSPWPTRRPWRSKERAIIRRWSKRNGWPPSARRSPPCPTT